MRRRASDLERISGLGPFMLLVLVVLWASFHPIAAWDDRGDAAGGALTLPQAYVYLQPDLVELGVGLQQTVHVMVDNVDDLHAYEIRLSFSNNLMQVQDAAPPIDGVQIIEGSVFDGLSAYTILNQADNERGVIEYTRSLNGPVEHVHGGGVLASIVLEGQAAGNGVLSFVDVVLLTPDGRGIPVTVFDGQVEVDVVSTTSTPAPTHTPTPTGTLIPISPTNTPVPPTVVPPCEVRAVPIAQEIGVGETGVLQLVVDNVQDLYWFDLRADYNGALLDVEDAQGGLPGIQLFMGDVFDGFGSQIIDNYVDDDGLFGQAHLSAFINDGSARGFDGNAVLGWITFRGVSPGVTNIVLSEVTLLNRAGMPIERLVYHGQIRVVASDATRTPTATPSPIATVTPTGPVVPTETGTPAATSEFTPTPTQTTLLATATASPILPTPIPVCTDMVENGGFEDLSGDEALPWVRQGGVAYTTEHNTGVRSARLGGANSANDALYQQVTIPPASGPFQLLTQVTLGYWWGMITEESSHPHDWFTVCVRDTAGTKLRDLQVVSDSTLLPQWRYIEHDLSEFAGQTIRICFEATTDEATLTSFFVDDVALTVCQVFYPTSTPTPTETATSTLTPTSTETSTVTPTATRTNTPAPTPSITPTPVVEVFQALAGVYEDTIDSYITSWEPDANYGWDGGMRVRTTGDKRSLIQFDISRIPAGVTVIRARLWLRTTWQKTHPQVMTVNAYGLRRPWHEMQVTWRNASDGVPWGVAGADGPADRDSVSSGARVMSEVHTWYDIDITGLVQDWVSGARPNHGLILIASGNTVEMSFWTSEFGVLEFHPKLEIAYSWGYAPVPTSAPTTLTPTPTATLIPVSPGSTLVLQQGKDGYAGTDDAYISAWEPTENYGSYVTMIARPNDIRNSLIRFDLSGIPAGQTLEKATLRLFCVRRSNAGGTYIDIYPVLRPWAESQATWGLASLNTPWGQAGCNQVGVDRGATSQATLLAQSENAWHEWEITEMVRGWLSSPSANYGMILRASGQNAVEYVYATSEYWWSMSNAPQLVLSFSGS